MALHTVSGAAVEDVVVDGPNPPAEASASPDDIWSLGSMFVDQSTSPTFLAEDRARVRAELEAARAKVDPAFDRIRSIFADGDLRDEAKVKRASEANRAIEEALAEYEQSYEAEQQKLVEWEARAPRLVPNPDGIGFRVGPEQKVTLDPAIAVELRGELRRLDAGERRGALVAAARAGNHELLQAARSMNAAFPLVPDDVWQQVDEILLQKSPAFAAIESARAALAARESILLALRRVAARFRGGR